MFSQWIRGYVRVSVVLLFVVQGVSGQPSPAQSDIATLSPGHPIERELKGDAAHSYVLSLTAGQYLDLVVQQKGIDVVVTLFDPNNQKLGEVDSPNGTVGPEPVVVLVAVTGTYRLEVRSLEPAAPVGRYEVKIVELRTATARDQEKFDALRLLAEGDALRDQRTAAAARSAIGKYEEAARLFHGVADRNGEALALNGIGLLYNNLGEKQRALEYYNQSLQLRRALGDKDGEGTLLNNLGIIYADQGDTQKALELYTQALPLLRSAGDIGVEAITLSNIGAVYRDRGELRKALEYYTQALPLHRQAGNAGGEATTLNNMGAVYGDLHETQKAIEFYERALPLRRQTGDKNGEAQTLSNIGFIYYRTDQAAKSLGYYQQALTLQQTTGDKRGQSITLNNIGAAYADLNDDQKALENYLLALPLAQSLGDKNHEARTLNNIARVYDRGGDPRKARDQYARVFLLLRTGSDENGQAVALNNLFFACEELAQPRLAFFYGKLSVNSYQSLRAKLKGLDKSAQQTFLRSIEYGYRRLANYLLAEKHYAEAQEVLNLFKDQQYFDFNSDRASAPLTLTPRETQLAAEFNGKVAAAVLAVRQLDDLRRRIGRRQPSAAEAAELQNAEKDVRRTNDDYLAFLARAEKDLTGPSGLADQLPPTADLTSIQTTLRETSAATGQKTVAIYTLVGADDYRALVVTPTDVFAVSSPIKGAELNQRAQQLWSLLRTPKYDPRPLSKEVYDLVFAPLAAQLPKDTQTIIWSLDGNLRYLPIASLYDGKQYLVERFQNVVFTRADRERMTRPVNPRRSGSGFGSSDAHQVEFDGGTLNADALPYVRVELDKIFRQSPPAGPLTGNVLLNAGFTRAAMLAQLREQRPLVHIASHFRFTPGDEARSFLLLGDGSPFTLDELKQQPAIFAGIDLLTLSACSTAAQRPDANGREVDGFAELAQRLGAGAVIASLWEVADDSTAELMAGFYRGYRGANGPGKAAALRRAQLSLLKGEYRGTGTAGSRLLVQENMDGIKLDPSRLILFRVDPRKPFAHPYYWSPFILVGNWK